MRRVLILSLLAFASCAPTPSMPLTACWVDGVAIYDCPEGTPLVWPAVPLTYAVDLDAEQADLADAVHKAAEAWNTATGIALYVPAVTPEEAVVTIRSGSWTPDGGAGATTHYGTTGPESAVVELREVPCVTGALAATTHELGHVLGLGHGTLVMAERQPDYCDAETSPSLWGLLPSDADVAWLQQTYGP